jgi:hypothetical protein
MYSNLAVSLERADELLKDLLEEYNKSLNEKKVSDRAVQLTHEICERLRSVLDRAASRYWNLRIKPELSEEEQKAASIYFPIVSDQQGFDSTLGRWRWKTVKNRHQPVADYLLRLQPFKNASNRWLSILNDLAVQGKHIDLVPQTKTEERRITVWLSQLGPRCDFRTRSVGRRRANRSPHTADRSNTRRNRENRNMG